MDSCISFIVLTNNLKLAGLYLPQMPSLDMFCWSQLPAAWLRLRWWQANDLRVLAMAGEADSSAPTLGEMGYTMTL